MKSTTYIHAETSEDRAMPLVRPRNNGDDDVVIQRKVWFLPRSWKIAWYDYSSLRNNLHVIEGKILQKAKEIEKLCQAWSSEKETLEAEIKAVKANRYSNLGVGEPFYIKEKALRDWVGGSSFVPRPEESWKAVLSDFLLFKYGMRGKPGKRTSIPNASIPKEATEKSGTSRYVLGEHHNLLIQGGEQVIGFKEERRGGNNQQGGISKNRMKQLRNDYPKEPGESDQDWNNRLQSIAKHGSDN